MLKKVTSVVWAGTFVLETALSSFPAYAGTEVYQAASPSPRSLFTKEVILDPEHPTANVAGLELFFAPKAALLHSPLRVKIDCFSVENTPPMKLDARVYGSDARLLNLTDQAGSGCSSFLVAAASAGNVDGEESIKPTGEDPPPGIAVSFSQLARDGRTSSVFVFNPVHGNWTEPHSYKPAKPEAHRAYATLTEQYQRIITGVVILPDKLTAEPAAQSPASIADSIGKVGPNTGMRSFAEVGPDSKGSLATDVPLYLRKSRGPGPSFSVAYSSAGAPGVLGRGWDLSVGSIQVRGPAPIYNPQFETEDYYLDGGRFLEGGELIAMDRAGTDMAPLYKGGPIVPRVKGTRFFHLRNNAKGITIRRYGDSPDTYYWEVWEPETSVTRLYGGHLPQVTSDVPALTKPALNSDGNGLLTGLENGRPVTGEWGLTQEYDNNPARNGSSYLYEPPGCDTSWKSNCTHALRPMRIEYNRSFGTVLGAVGKVGETDVIFDWTKRAPKRFNSDGRLGFFRAQEYWLSKIEVRYKASPKQLQLASAGPALSPSPRDIVFSKQRFDLSDGNDPCTNYDALLKQAVLEESEEYDPRSAERQQPFALGYEGEDHCSKSWPVPQLLAGDSLGNLPEKAPTGLGFPSELVEGLGFGLLRSQSMLGTGQSDEIGASLYVGIGPNDDTSSKPISGGIKGGVNFTRSEGASTLVDVTGDGIDDIVFRNGGNLKYCGGVRRNFQVSFPKDRCGDIQGIGEFSVSSSSTNSAGVEVHAGSGIASAFAGVGYNDSSNSSYVYFTQRDADGLVDLVTYGQVLYGQGESIENVDGIDKRIVSFLPKSALTPPIPHQVSSDEIAVRLPPDLENTIGQIGGKLEKITRKLLKLDYSQTTISWEAPLDGDVHLKGSLQLDGGRQHFPDLLAEVRKFRRYFYDCKLWPQKEYCYSVVSDPYGPHYTRPKDPFDFLDSPPSVVQLSLFRKESGAVLTCASMPIRKPGKVKLEDFKTDASVCHAGNAAAGSLAMKTGDVLYLTYSIDPDMTASLKPDAEIEYARVDGDYAFNLASSSGQDKITPLLNCGWGDQPYAKFGGDCLLEQQSRYTFNLATGELTSSPGQTALLRSGSDREFRGKFEIPAAVTRDYKVSFEVLGAAGQSMTSASPDLQVLFRQDVSESCLKAGDICQVSIAPTCASEVPQSDCDTLLAANGTPGPAFLLRSRLTIEHRAAAGTQALNLSSRLARVIWLQPPQILSKLTETGNKPAVEPSKPLNDKKVIVYLPVEMGDPDLEYARVTDGIFPNPNPELNEQSPTPEKIGFDQIADEEIQNTNTARVRQMVHLCGFAREIMDFLEVRYTPDGQPFAESYISHWRAKMDAVGLRCRNAKVAFEELDFTTGEAPERLHKTRLNLPHLLGRLTYADQISSAETLLERVFRNLELPEELLTDAPRMSRRGYRLPVKANPLDCDLLTPDATPVASPIFGPEAGCSYRLLANFAMVDFKQLLGKDAAGKLDKLLEQFRASSKVAFRLELTATANGVPVSFHELSGEKAANEKCTPEAGSARTCLGNYGSFDNLDGDLFPDDEGDLLQRITTNLRPGRAVAFSDDILDTRYDGVCIAAERKYKSLVAMEAKQDCTSPPSNLTDAEKYLGLPQTAVQFAILENNQFVGRNRVLEFQAHPLDLVEFHIRLVPEEQTIETTAADGTPFKLRGNFSVFDVDSKLSNEIGIVPGKHLIPRSPLQTLSSTDDPLACPAPQMGSPQRLPSSCRPWSKLGWGEILLGAEYRTYSDAQHRTIDKNQYSILRRRELLRLQPEIEVEAQKYDLRWLAGSLPLANELYAAPETGPQISLTTRLGVAANIVAALRVPDKLRLVVSPVLAIGPKMAIPQVYYSSEPLRRNFANSLEGALHSSFVRRIVAYLLPTPKLEQVTLPAGVPVMLSRLPNIPKIGGEWSMFAGRAGLHGAVIDPPAFSELRYKSQDPRKPGQADPNTRYDSAFNACGAAYAADYDGCRKNIATDGEEALDFSGVSLFPLIHQFVGPANVDAAVDDAIGDDWRNIEAGNPCSASVAMYTASCWKGQDDTVFWQRPVLATSNSGDGVKSVSALIGFERPPISQFQFEFDAFTRLACLDRAKDRLPVMLDPSDLLAWCPVKNFPGQTAGSKIPNRPNPPEDTRAIEVFAPVQGSGSETVSFNSGIGFVNYNRSWTKKETTSLFADVNGDGYPDVISNGTAELTAPVGLTRRDWWRYFRTTTAGSGLTSELSAGGFDQKSTSSSEGSGVALSPSTVAVPNPKGTDLPVHTTPEASVEPGFNLNFETGRDDSFSELRDFNGDGLTDIVTGGSLPAGLSLKLNAGSALQNGGASGSLDVNGKPIEGFQVPGNFNESHTAGLGVRLGYSNASGSLVAGMGLSHHDSTSEGVLLDFTGDGRVDIVVPVTNRDGKNQLAVFPNLGNGFGPAKLHTIPQWDNAVTGASESSVLDAGAQFTFGFPIWLIKIVFTPGVKHARDQQRELLQIRDFNGDGVPDIATVSGLFRSRGPGLPDLKLGDLETRVHYNPEARYHLLSFIKNPSGSEYHLGYTLLGNTGPEHGSPVWALSSVALYDGFDRRYPEYFAPALLGGDFAPDGQDVRLTLYDYKNGYFNRAERQFYGFANRVSTVFGCDLSAGTKEMNCLSVLAAKEVPSQEDLRKGGYVRLQEVDDAYSNKDFLTQGVLLSATTSGSVSGPDSTAAKEEELKVTSRSTLGYTIDNLATNYRPKDKLQCVELPKEKVATSWATPKDGSDLSSVWNGIDIKDNEAVLGEASLCGTDVANCAETLAERMCGDGYVREQTAFWAQQTGSVRQRFAYQEAFANGGEGEGQLTSAAGFDHDQWGQVVAFDSIGEMVGSGAQPAALPSSSVHAIVGYAKPPMSEGLLQGLNGFDQVKGAPVRTGYPMLGLANQIEIFDGPWKNFSGEGSREPLRAREAIYTNNGRGNVSDVCIYPGGEGFHFKSGMCHAYKSAMRDALEDGYSTLQSALRAAYAKTDGLPKGVDRFDAIIHHQIVGYDDFGNVTHVVSPLSEGKEWIERRFDYSGDPFLTTETTTELTRCVEDTPGAGANTKGVDQSQVQRCTLGLPKLPETVARKPVTHLSHNRIDPHLGAVAESTDINGNSLLFDYDGWGRLDFIARSWGKQPRENKTFSGILEQAGRKVLRSVEAAAPAIDPRSWRILAVADYSKDADGLLRSNVRKFEPSDSYEGLLEEQNSTRESAVFADGLGRPIQTITEADVCLEALPAIINGVNPGARVGLGARCTGVSTGIVTPGSQTDVLGRELATFESYPIAANSNAQHGSDLRFTTLQRRADTFDPISRTTYDAGSRPLTVENRLSRTQTGQDGQKHVAATAQFSYRIVPRTMERGARFESLSLSPRCTVTYAWGDARGLTTDVFENQTSFFYAKGDSAPEWNGEGRDYTKTQVDCLPIEQADQQALEGHLPSQVVYSYDPLQQLTNVDYPLKDDEHTGVERAGIDVRYDRIGRMTEMREPDSGCTLYHYDALNNLTSETGYKYQGDRDKACATASSVRNEKSYRYAADRLLQMSYHSLEEQGDAKDKADDVRFYYDRFPYAALSGEILETPRFVPNDQANQRFVDVTGRNCENCIGQVTVVADRTGAQSHSYNELGLPSREVRSIVGPLHKVKNSGGGSETYMPEVAFYELENSYTSFGDIAQQEFNESAPMNPSLACLDAGVETCIARFTLGRKYGPDGKVAELLFNGKPLVSSAHDALGRPAVRWTGDGTVTGFKYDPFDLRMNQLSTITAGLRGKVNVPVQMTGYQYDGGGNVVGYRNNALPNEAKDEYESSFGFTYDPANRLTEFSAKVRKGPDSLVSNGTYGYDIGHRMTTATLDIVGTPGETFHRSWSYDYGNKPGDAPVHAPSAITFGINKLGQRTATLGYDDVGRVTRVDTAKTGDDSTPEVLSNRAMTWDAEGRLIAVRGLRDGAQDDQDDNVDWLREDYIYDYGGNRTLKIHRPRQAEVKKADDAPVAKQGQTGGSDSKELVEGEAATIYMTPFYARGNDGRGAVQIAEGSLPTASLTPPADESEDPPVTYLFSDLAVGSVSASVTAFGEVENAASTVIGRREYGPYGLELTADALAKAGREGAAPLSVFHAKELDRTTHFSSFGARYYSRDLGIWLSPDPALVESLSDGRGASPSSISQYSFANMNPVRSSDPDGNAAMIVVFPDYIIHEGGYKIRFLGHAGSVIIDDATGATKYYEYGRYDKPDFKGLVRSRPVPNLEMKDGKPTARSMLNLLRTLSQKSGEHGAVSAGYDSTAQDFSAMVKFADSRLAKNKDPNRKEYGNCYNNCYSFAESVAASGRKGFLGFLKNVPGLGDVVPDVPTLKSDYDVIYNPKNDKIGGLMYLQLP